MQAVLVSVDHAHGSAAIVRDGDRVWLAAGDAHEIDDRGVTAVALPEGLWVVGGLLPAPATRAVLRTPGGGVVDAALGDGAWLAVCFTDAAPVRFEAVDGLLIKRPTTSLGAYWSPVADAPEACPACNSGTWEHAEGEVRCAACGFPAREPATHHGRCRRAAGGGGAAAGAGLGRLARRLRRPAVPRYAAAGVRVAAAHLDDGEPPAERLRAALMSALEAASPPAPDGSPAAQRIHRAAQLRHRRAAAALAVPFTQTVQAEGEALRFTGLRTRGSWAMGAVVGTAHVTVSGNDAVAPPDHLRRAG